MRRHHGQWMAKKTARDPLFGLHSLIVPAHDSAFKDFSRYKHAPSPQNGIAADNTETLFGRPTASLNGTNQRVRFNADPVFGFDSDDFTVQGWVNLQGSVGGTQSILSVYPAGTGFNLFVNENPGRTDIYQNGIELKNAGSTQSMFNSSGVELFPHGIWHHAIYSRHGNTGYIGMDGKVLHSASLTIPIPYNGSDMNIGFNGSGFDLWLKGRTAQLRITRGFAYLRGLGTYPVPRCPFPLR